MVKLLDGNPHRHQREDDHEPRHWSLSRSRVIKFILCLSIPPIFYNFIEVSEFSEGVFRAFQETTTTRSDLNRDNINSNRNASHHDILTPDKSTQGLEGQSIVSPEKQDEIVDQSLEVIQQKQNAVDKTPEQNPVETATTVATETVQGTPDLPVPVPTLPETVTAASTIPSAHNIPVIDYNYDFVQYPDHRTRFGGTLPDWMEEFLARQPANNPQAHHELLTNPDNKFIVMTCYKHSNGKLEDCGGFSDRLKLMPYQMWLAHKTGRYLLIKYFKPRPLEEFLVPPQDGFEWRLPDGYLMDEWYEYGNRTFEQYQGDRRRSWDQRILPGERHYDEKWANHKAIFTNINLAIPSIEHRQNGLVGTPVDELWPELFRRLFQPSPAVANAMAPLLQQYSLTAGSYASAHLRVRWPGGYGRQIKFVNQKWWKADKNGGAIDMSDANTTRVVALLGNHAVECAVRIMPETDYVYVASDGAEVVEYLRDTSDSWRTDAVDSPPRTWVGPDPALANSTNATEHGWGVPAWEVPTTAKIIARPDYKVEPPHFDGTAWPSPDRLFPVFVDLWMMMHAKCHSLGIGGFGRFGSVLSGNHKSCASRHRDYNELSPSCPTGDERKAWITIHPDARKKKGSRRRRRRRRF